MISSARSRSLLFFQHFNNRGPFKFTCRIVLTFPLTKAFIFRAVRIDAGPNANTRSFAGLKLANFSFRAIVAATAWPGAEAIEANRIFFAGKEIELW